MVFGDVGDFGIDCACPAHQTIVVQLPDPARNPISDQRLGCGASLSRPLLQGLVERFRNIDRQMMSHGSQVLLTTYGIWTRRRSWFAALEHRTSVTELPVLSSAGTSLARRYAPRLNLL